MNDKMTSRYIGLLHKPFPGMTIKQTHYAIVQHTVYKMDSLFFKILFKHT